MSARLQLSVNVLLASAYSTETSTLGFPAQQTYLREALDLLGLLHMSVMADRASVSFPRKVKQCLWEYRG